MDTSFLSELNWLAMLVAALAYFAIGALWYSVFFGKAWVRLWKIDTSSPDATKGAGLTMLLSFVWIFVITMALAVIVHRLELETIPSGIRWGLLTGFGFSFATTSITYLYTKKPLGLYLIDGLYHVAGQVAVAVILCAWQ